jgi:two-component system, cell cycle response regulator DivK
MSLILIVEDNEKNLKLLRDILQFKGYRTLEAGTGGDGVRIARESAPDLVLMDIQLPDMNGAEALKQLRADPRTSAIPVLAVSASVMPEERNRILASGFDGFQSKPIKMAEFLEAVTGALKRGKKGAA